MVPKNTAPSKYAYNSGGGTVRYTDTYDPNATTYTPTSVLGTSTLSGGSTSNLGSQGTVTSGFSTPQLAAAYDQAINNTQAQYDRQGNILNSGYSDISSSLQNALNQLLLNRNRGETSYKENKQTSATDYVGAKNQIGSQAGESINGLQRLLGARGAGGSSAYLQAAPQAVTRGATLQRGTAANQFGANSRALDSNYNNFLIDYGNQVNSANSQSGQQRKSLESSIDTNRASLLQSLAQLQAQKAEALGGSTTAASQPYLDQANSILDHLSNYQTAPINYQTNAYQAPSLASYQTAANPTAQFNSNAGGDYYSPFLQSLLGKKQQVA